jgi:hypothetical protein
MIELLRRQQIDGFPDLGGAEASATIPVADRLINQVIAEAIPKGGTVQDLRIHAEAGDRFRVRVRLSISPLMPAIGATLTIEEQPVLPERPVLGLRISGIPKLLMQAGGFARARDALPPGVRLEGEYVRLDLERLLKDRGQADLLRYLTFLNVTTRDGVVVVAIRARIPRSRDPNGSR